jgi:hypothetical protein
VHVLIDQGQRPGPVLDFAVLAEADPLARDEPSALVLQHLERPWYTAPRGPDQPVHRRDRPAGRDSESRHTVCAENEIPDIGEYARGQAEFWQVWDVRAKRIRARGRAFHMGKIGAQQDKIITRRDPARLPGSSPLH